MITNLLFTGREAASVGMVEPSAAQRRCQQQMLGKVRAFLRGLEPTSGEATIESYLRDGASYSTWLRDRVLPLGEQAGVPDRAAVVPLAGILAERWPEMSLQIQFPIAASFAARSSPAQIAQTILQTVFDLPVLG